EGEIFNRIHRKDGRIYFDTHKGFVYCLNAEDYKLLWRLQIQELLSSPVYIGQSHLYVFDQDNNVYCFDLDGKPCWQTAAQEEITSPLREIGDLVLWGTSQGRFTAVDVLTGEEAWHFRAQGAIRSNPVSSERCIIFGSDDCNLYFLDRDGNLVDQYEAEDTVRDTLLVNGKFLYFGAGDDFFVCFDLKKRMQKWEVRIGGHVIPTPLSVRKRVFFLAWNNVLYCLHKRNGSILWWRSIPSRSLYQLEVVEDKIVVSSMSSILVCFDIETGVKFGETDVGKEIKSNPLWNPPHLLVNVYDKETGMGKIYQMKKTLQVTLTPSLTSPRLVNEEIVFSVATVGFHQPEYEFFVKTGGEKEIVQAESDRNTWNWFPNQAGDYKVGVKVWDEKEEKEVEVPFVIEKVKPKITLYSSRLSPQETNKKIVLKTSAAGMGDTNFGLRINPVVLVQIGKRYVITLESADQEAVAVEKTEENEWTWIPERQGLYMIGVVATDDEGKADIAVLYLVMNKKGPVL
ncbi:MAG: PQQ-binding-like beta-propeller repeat protein, partial [Candidatus Aminicenantes bacterium]